MSMKAFRLTAQRSLESCTLQDAMETAENEESVSRVYWIDIDGTDRRTLCETLESLRLHPLATEACLEPVSVSGLVAYGESLFIGLPIQATWDAERRSFLRIICLPKLIVTVHDRKLPALNQIAERYSGSLRFHGTTNSAILYQILDHLIDDDMAFTLRTRDGINRLEEYLDEDTTDELTEEALSLKRHLSRLSATCEDQLYCVGLLQTIESESFSVDGLHDYFRDAVSHLEHVSRSIARQVVQLTTIQQEYQLNLQQKSNDRLRLLTVISTIFLPLSLIASVYGMNFQNMPGLEWDFGFVGVLIVMVAIATGMLWGLYRAGWFR